jgi:short-subunit dehydrogenase
MRLKLATRGLWDFGVRTWEQKAMTETLRGKTALITGASSGLGADFARHLAACGCQLVLVARRAERLRELQTEISTRHGVSVECVAMDLVETDAPQRLYDQLNSMGRAIDVLINNAGRGLYGEFTTVPWESLHQMLELDIIALTHLTRLFVADMVKRESGYILLVASTGAFQPTPTYAAYSAAKSYVLSLGEALHYELRQTGVRCTVICPGVTRTEFFDVAGQRMTPYQRMTMMESSTVARIGIEAMLRGRSSVVAGRLNAIFAWATRLLPRQILTGLAARAMRESPLDGIERRIL